MEILFQSNVYQDKGFKAMKQHIQLIGKVRISTCRNCNQDVEIVGALHRSVIKIIRQYRNT